MDNLTVIIVNVDEVNRDWEVVGETFILGIKSWAM